MDNSAAADTSAPPAAGSRDLVLALAFFLSGAAALIYQVCWQRLLGYAFGVDTESTTIVVSSFMLGLGIGALAGGWLTDRSRNPLLLFCALETGIGIYGLISNKVIGAISMLALDSHSFEFALLNFLILLPPTVLMGCTLPVLVVAMSRHSSIGVSTGTLYCVNTFGAATGAALTAFHLFPASGIRFAIACAVAINFVTAAGVFAASRMVKP